MKRLGWLAVAVASCLMAVGCGGGRKVGDAPKNLQGIEFPDWVNKGTGAFDKGDSQVFYGVGSVTGIRNHSLARTTADNRARAEIAKVFETYTASLMKDYMASTTAGDMGSSSEEQHVESVIKTFSAQTLSGVLIVDHWFHPLDGTVYALASLDLDSFAKSVGEMKELNAKVRDFVRDNAERSFSDLESAEAQR